MAKRIIFALIGTAIVLLLSLLRRKKYNYGIIKVVSITTLFVIIAIIGGLLMPIIESGSFGGNSLYGCIFITPLAIIVYCFISKDNWKTMLDFYVPSIAIMIAVLKISCFSLGCCNGIAIFEQADGTFLRFPSQIVEAIVAILITVLFLCFEKKKLFVGNYYAIFFIVYGSTRFILNSFRDGLTPFVWYLPAGHFWSVMSIIIGLIWIIFEQNNDSVNEIIE